MNRTQWQASDYWENVEQRFRELFPDGLTQDEIDRANEVIWQHCYPTKQMMEEDEQEQQDLLQP